MEEDFTLAKLLDRSGPKSELGQLATESAMEVGKIRQMDRILA